jgi:SAM-dependent methyltransferase
LRQWHEGVDLDAEPLVVARERLPEVPLHEGDMVTLDLGRRFDVVTCLFSSIGYAVTEKRLRAACAALARHVAPGGLLVLEPWLLPEAWQPGHVGAVFVDEPELKIARMNTAGEVAETVVLDFHYLVATPDSVEHFAEQHELGMFTRDEYHRSVRTAGLDAEWDDEGLTGRGLVLGRRGA